MPAKLSGWAYFSTTMHISVHPIKGTPYGMREEIAYCNRYGDGDLYSELSKRQEQQVRIKTMSEYQNKLPCTLSKRIQKDFGISPEDASENEFSLVCVGERTFYGRQDVIAMPTQYA
ncbi:hypothetical protein CEXT_443991 [Caerostris extrusa]|uniref:Uncharacterized protein n=1 Tax=Caerostris extrusa TaxID=172846 RepID=A0AAV4SPV9_CAEEX|nr:hypothetical protein CEXT_443991 [Caerostris extrusa]